MRKELLNLLDIQGKLHKQKTIIESEGHKVAFICLYGSQNYGLDLNNEVYQSDVDMKAIIVPSLDDLINNSKPISTTINTEWGQCDLKDIRNYFETLLKANPAYIETLFTDYFVIDHGFKEEFNLIHSMREDLVKTLRVQFIRAMYGMMCEKEKAMCHPYPTIAHKIEKFGFDGKQAHHIHRLNLLMNNYYEDKLPLSKCFYPPKEEVEFLIDIKLNKYSLESTKIFVNETMEAARLLRDKITEGIDESKIDYSIKNEFISLSHKIIKNKIVNEIKGV